MAPDFYFLTHLTSFLYFELFNPDSKMVSFIVVLKYLNSCIPLLIIAVGLVGNIWSFVIFRFHPEMKRISSMMILSFISIYDLLSLWGWNLNHFIDPMFHIRIENTGRFECKFFNFVQVVTIQASAILLAYLSIDRYFLINSMPGSFISRLPFGTTRSSLVTSIILSLIVVVYNLNVFIYSEFSFIPENSSNLTNSSHLVPLCYLYKPERKMAAIMDIASLFMGCFLPFVLMVIFNSLIIRTIRKLKSNHEHHKSPGCDSSRDKSLRKMHKTTLSLLAISVLFVVMSFPSKLAFGFFNQYFTETGYDYELLRFLDNISFAYNSSLFLLCFITNIKFRKAVYETSGYFLQRLGFKGTKKAGDRSVAMVTMETGQSLTNRNQTETIPSTSNLVAMVTRD